MTGPDWLRWLLAGAFLAVAGYCVARLVRADRRYPGCARSVDLAHVLMGVGMAVMVSPAGGPVPHAGWQTVFLLLTLWFAGTWVVDRGRPVPHWHGSALHHAIAAVAMLYMLTAAPHEGMAMGQPWTSGHSMGALALPLVGWGLAAYLLVHAGQVAWRALPVPTLRRTGACQLVMSLGAVVMLVPAL
jgi:hypothetical protein